MAFSLRSCYDVISDPQIFELCDGMCSKIGKEFRENQPTSAGPNILRKRGGAHPGLRELAQTMTGKQGFITKALRRLNDPRRYAICPVIKDPTNGAIARDQFLAYTRKPDTPLEPEFVQNFNSLQTTGRPAN